MISPPSENPILKPTTWNTQKILKLTPLETPQPNNLLITSNLNDKNTKPKEQHIGKKSPKTNSSNLDQAPLKISQFPSIKRLKLLKPNQFPIKTDLDAHQSNSSVQILFVPSTLPNP